MAFERIYQVDWTEEALREVGDAAAYIARDSVLYADALVEAAIAAAETLTHSPLRGRVVPEFEGGVREIFVKSYRLIYEISGNTVSIRAFIHGARNFPIQ